MENLLDSSAFNKNESIDLLFNQTILDCCNSTEERKLPLDMQFNDGHLISITGYIFLAIFSATGNVYVLLSLIKLRMTGKLSRVNLLLLHLAIADLIVTFVMMPMEIAWNITVTWKGGDFLCRFFSFFRIFGIYLSGFVITCISFDRYFAIIYPLSFAAANYRSNKMLGTAWAAAVVCSAPQSLIFHVEKHPIFTWYEQCITVNSFSTKGEELAYNYFGFTFMYAVPMTAILFCYGCILYSICKANVVSRDDGLRRSSTASLNRAKTRTFKMTVVIVVTFFLCWFPYHVICLWYWIDPESATKIDYRIQKCLFLFACANSCANPLIYGVFHIRSQNRSNQQRRREAVIAEANAVVINENEPGRRPVTEKRVKWNHNLCICPAVSTSSNVIGNQNPAEDHVPIINQAQPQAITKSRDYEIMSKQGTSSVPRPLTSQEFQSNVQIEGVDTNSFTTECQSVNIKGN